MFETSQCFMCILYFAAEEDFPVTGFWTFDGLEMCVLRIVYCDIVIVDVQPLDYFIRHIHSFA